MDRLALNLGLEPTLVYLHAGARIGARRLMDGLPREEGWAVFRRNLPSELRVFDERELEDILCLYKDQFFDPPSESVTRDARMACVSAAPVC